MSFGQHLLERAIQHEMYLDSSGLRAAILKTPCQKKRLCKEVDRKEVDKEAPHDSVGRQVYAIVLRSLRPEPEEYTALQALNLRMQA
jgi:hypothetical protein